MFVDTNPVQAGLSLGGREGEIVFVDNSHVQAGLSLGGAGGGWEEGREGGGDSVLLTPTLHRQV